MTILKRGKQQTTARFFAIPLQQDPRTLQAPAERGVPHLSRPLRRSKRQTHSVSERKKPSNNCHSEPALAGEESAVLSVGEEPSSSACCYPEAAESLATPRTPNEGSLHLQAAPQTWGAHPSAFSAPGWERQNLSTRGGASCLAGWPMLSPHTKPGCPALLAFFARGRGL
jgi:hypothetical protein